MLSGGELEGNPSLLCRKDSEVSVKVTNPDVNCRSHLLGSSRMRCSHRQLPWLQACPPCPPDLFCFAIHTFLSTPGKADLFGAHPLPAGPRGVRIERAELNPITFSISCHRRRLEGWFLGDAGVCGRGRVRLDVARAGMGGTGERTSPLSRRWVPRCEAGF